MRYRQCDRRERLKARGPSRILAPSSDGRNNGKCRVEMRFAGETQVRAGPRLFEGETGNPEQRVKCSIARWHVWRGIVSPSRNHWRRLPGRTGPLGARVMLERE